MSRLLLLSTAEKRYVIRRHGEGHTAAELAEFLQVPVAWVLDALRNPPPPKDDSRPIKPTSPKEPRPRRAPKRAPADLAARDAEILKLAAEGVTPKQLADRFHITLGRVYQLLAGKLVGYPLGAET